MNNKIFWEKFNYLKNIGIKNKYPNISEEVAKYLIYFLNKNNYKNILEIGACNGLSTYTLAFFTQKEKSKITTIEKDMTKKEELLSNLADFLDRIKIYIGDALEILPILKEKYDFVFIDAMKKQYINYLSILFEKNLLDEEYLIIIDNVIKFKHKMLNLYDYLDKNKINYNILSTKDDGIMIIKKPPL